MSDTLPAWIVCACGHDVFCVIHQMHVMDCACPDYDDWKPLDIDPFKPMFVVEATQ
jgi:hypothetical protein